MALQYCFICKADVMLLQVAPTHLRGTLGSVNQLVICFGILGALVCNIALPATQWRTIFALTAIPAVLLFLGRLALVKICPVHHAAEQLKCTKACACYLPIFASSLSVCGNCHCACSTFRSRKAEMPVYTQSIRQPGS